MKHKSRDYKISAVKYYLKSLNYTETATIFGCSRQSLTRWVKQPEKAKDTEQKIKKKSLSIFLNYFFHQIFTKLAF